MVPVKLEPCEVPAALRHLHWVNLFRVGGYHRLRDALQAAGPRRAADGSSGGTAGTAVDTAARGPRRSAWRAASAAAGVLAVVLAAAAVAASASAWPGDRPSPDNTAGRTPAAVPTTGETITVWNKVTGGATSMVEDTPAYLSTEPTAQCKRLGCALAGTDLVTDDQVLAVCRATGVRITNGNNGDPADDNNPGLFASPLWYGVRWTDGRFGYLSEVWVHPADRKGLGLPGCPSPADTPTAGGSPGRREPEPTPG